jgi:hypothetical protein
MTRPYPSCVKSQRTRLICCVCSDPAAGEAWDYVAVFVEEPDADDGTAGMQQEFGAHASCLRRVFAVQVGMKHPSDRD